MEFKESKHENIRNAMEQFKKAIEATGKKDVVIIYSYRGKAEDSETLRDMVYTSSVADNFMQVLGTCDVVRGDILNGE